MTAVTSNPLRYIGGELEGGAIYLLGARYYDASLGRITQMDPTGQEANPYAYASDDPTNSLDSSGTLNVRIVVKIVEALLTGRSVLAVLSYGNLISFAISAIIEIACNAAFDAISAGVGAIVGVLGCGALGWIIEDGLDSLLSQEQLEHQPCRMAARP